MLSHYVPPPPAWRLEFVRQKRRTFPISSGEENAKAIDKMIKELVEEKE